MGGKQLKDDEIVAEWRCVWLSGQKMESGPSSVVVLV